MKSADLKNKLSTIIFGTNTKSGRVFDIVLIWLIVFSVLAVLLESVQSIRGEYGDFLRVLEWGFTIIFSIEYALRIYCAPKRSQYIKSFFGLIDLFSIIPTYLSIYLPGSQSFLVLRGLRILRIFRVLKLVRFSSEGKLLLNALKASRPKITVFLGAVVCLVLILGACMYLIEGEEHGFSSIPKGIYWAIVTLTTVGYGDIAPQTLLGQFLASIVMILGYSIIAIPTGIVSAELTSISYRSGQQIKCQYCQLEGHTIGSRFCRGCGNKLALPDEEGEKLGEDQYE